MHLFQLFLLLTAISASNFFPLLGKRPWEESSMIWVQVKGNDAVATHALISLHILKLCAKRKCFKKIRKGRNILWLSTQREYLDVWVFYQHSYSSLGQKHKVPGYYSLMYPKAYDFKELFAIAFTVGLSGSFKKRILTWMWLSLLLDYFTQ